MKYKILKECTKDNCTIRLLKKGIIKKDYKLYIKLSFFETTIEFEDNFFTADSKFRLLVNIFSNTNKIDPYEHFRESDSTSTSAVQSKKYINGITLIKEEIKIPYFPIYYHLKIEKGLDIVSFFVNNEPDSIRLFDILEWILDPSKEKKEHSISNIARDRIEEELKKLGFKNRDYEKCELDYGTIRKCRIEGINYIITDFEFYNEMYIETECNICFDAICNYWRDIQLTKQPDFINRHPEHVVYEYIKVNTYKDIKLKLAKIKLGKDNLVNNILAKYQIEIFIKEKPTYLFFNDLEDASKCYNLINSHWKKINKQNKEEKEEENKMTDILREDKFNIGSISLWYHNDIMKNNLPLYDIRLSFSTKDNSMNCPVKLNIDNFVDAYELYKNTLNTIKNIESELMVSIYNQTYCKNENECSNFKKKKDKGGNRNEKDL